MTIKLITIVVLLFISFGFIAYFRQQNVYAQTTTDFSVSYDLVYDVKDDRKTDITQRGLLTNLTSEKYITSLELTINSQNIDGISAYDELGPINPEVNTTVQGTTIRLNFNKKNLGIGKNLTFTISYRNPDIARKTNSTWIINIPKAEVNPNIVAYNVSLKVPNDFGTPTFINPQPIGNNLSWNKDQIKNGGISLKFGEKANEPKKNESATSSMTKVKTNYITPLFYFLLILLLLLVLFIFIWLKFVKR